MLKHFEDVTFFDESMSELTTSGVTHCITILIVSAVMYYIKKKYDLNESVFLDNRYIIRYITSISWLLSI